MNFTAFKSFQQSHKGFCICYYHRVIDLLSLTKNGYCPTLFMNVQSYKN